MRSFLALMAPHIPLISHAGHVQHAILVGYQVCMTSAYSDSILIGNRVVSLRGNASDIVQDPKPHLKHQSVL